MDTPQILAHFYKQVNTGKPGADYKRRLKLYETYRTMITGNGLDDYLQRLTRRTDEVEWEMVKQITNHIIPSVCNNIMYVFNKVHRGKNVLLDYKYTDKSEKKTQEFTDVQGDFYNQKSVEWYLDQKFRDFSFVDPNGFIAINFIEPERNSEGAVTSFAMPFPTKVFTPNVFDYYYENGDLQYLTIKYEDTINISKNKRIAELPGGAMVDVGEKEYVKIDRFVLYTREQAFTLTETKAEGIKINNNFQTTTVAREINGIVDEYEVIRLNDKNYILFQHEPYNLEEVPAVQVGYVYDFDCDDDQLFVNPFHAALPYLKKLIKTVSEMDITMAYHAFPQKIQSVGKCDNQGCYGGRLQSDNSVCESCGGSGYKVHESATDVIFVPMGRSPEESFSLDNILKYVSPSTELIGVQSEQIDNNIDKAFKTVFNSEVISRTQITKTATEVGLDRNSIYDTLYPYAVKYASVWEFIIHRIAEIINRQQGLEVNTKISRDFKLKTLQDYLIDMKAAKDSGASQDVIRSINNKIIEIVYSDDEKELKKIRTREYFSPFPGKAKEEIMLLLANKPATWKYRVLYESEGFIFDEIEMELTEKGTDFYELTKPEQKVILDAKLDEIIKEAKNDPTLDME